MLIEAENSCLLVIDVQEKLVPAIHEVERVTANIAMLMKGAAILGQPVLVSEQYPEGLGKTVDELASLLPEGQAVETVEKEYFSCMSDEGYARRFAELGRKQAVVAGIEAHVCVLQTVMELLSQGRQVFVVEDAVSSRSPHNHRAAIRRMAAAGANTVTAEMVLFEWLRCAGTPEFKEISKMIKEAT